MSGSIHLVRRMQWNHGWNRSLAIPGTGRSGNLPDRWSRSCLLIDRCTDCCSSSSSARSSHSCRRKSRETYCRCRYCFGRSHDSNPDRRYRRCLFRHRRRGYTGRSRNCDRTHRHCHMYRNFGNCSAHWLRNRLQVSHRNRHIQHCNSRSCTHHRHTRRYRWAHWNNCHCSRASIRSHHRMSTDRFQLVRPRMFLVYRNRRKPRQCTFRSSNRNRRRNRCSAQDNICIRSTRWDRQHIAYHQYRHCHSRRSYHRFRVRCQRSNSCRGPCRRNLPRNHRNYTR